ncbi:MAG: polyprenyl synthetase family protein [Saprospiraceae bacterium]
MYSIAQLKDSFLDYLQENPFTKAPTKLFEPVDYIMQLGGKRIRPILVLMAYNLYEADIKMALPIAQAVEIFHNFSLVHDDIMDEAPLRRGKPTVHYKYDTNTGILSGDVMLIYAYHYLLKVEDKALIPEIIKTFTEVAEAVCIGQQYDMDFETSNEVTIPAYLMMIEHKTAFLLVGALKMGAILAKASEEDVFHLGEFGRNIGIAFQLQDDILDTFGDAATFGKRIGGDILQNKKTFLVLKTLAVASEKDKKELEKLMSTYPVEEAKKINDVKAIFQRNNIQYLANQVKNEYQDKAMNHLEMVGVADEKKEELKALATLLLKRKI